MKNPKEKMSPHLVQLVKMNNEFFKYLKFNYNKQIGFMTASPIYLEILMVILFLLLKIIIMNKLKN